MILAIESSCDESALALFDPARGITGEWVHTQVALHREYGGVVPDLASREHLRNFPVLLEAFHDTPDRRPVARIAVTRGPGLAGCLALGISLARSLGTAWGVPVLGANHLRGHAFSPFIPLHASSPAVFERRFTELLPHLGLLVSGGNTLLFRIDTDRCLDLLAQTVDDAAGEALDKGAKLLGFPYPGGPRIEREAAGGDPAAFAFPRAFVDVPDLKFSFSGLKTSLRYRLEKMDDAALRRHLPDLCASYQEAVVDALIVKLRQGLRRTGPYRSIGLSGGVANNTRLRAAFEELADREGVAAVTAGTGHTGDNAAMIAFAAWADEAGLQTSPRLEPSLRLDR